MKRLMIVVSLLLSFNAYANRSIETNKDRHFVIVSASYNNEKWYKWSLDSLFNQSYTNWHLFYTDDHSPDGTGRLVRDYIHQKGMQDKVTLVRNTKRVGALANQYAMIMQCKDDDIIVILDGDDALADRDVLKYLNGVYADPNVWMTYGQFREYPSGASGFCCQMPRNVVMNNAFRDFAHIPSHLRTFYAGLFKQIKFEDLLYEGNYFQMCADIAVMFPLIEMARDHFKFISRTLLIYNGANELNDHKVSKSFQRKMDLEIRSRKRYAKADSIFSS